MTKQFTQLEERFDSYSATLFFLFIFKLGSQIIMDFLLKNGILLPSGKDAGRTKSKRLIISVKICSLNCMLSMHSQELALSVLL